MKRIFAFTLILLMFASVLLTASAASATLTVTAGDCAPGSTIEVAFGLEKNSNIAAADFRVSYDTAAFEFVDYENGELIDNRLGVGNCKDGKVLFSTAGTDPIMDAGTLFTVKFKVDSKASGAHEFKFYTVSCCDYDQNKIKTEVAVAKVNISGKAVSKVEVKPVTSVDDNGSQVTVSAEVDTYVPTVSESKAKAEAEASANTNANTSQAAGDKNANGSTSGTKSADGSTTAPPLWFWAVCG
ncbi:MAG: hypothetical protein IKU10_03530, partial [Clostridia bacterium]|nr:hypothetical protein [Clostridia bacterium]